MPIEHEIPIDGQTISAIHHETDGDRWILFCHGFRSDKTGSYESRCERAVEEGYNAVRFDFRGSGESGGAFVESTLTTRIADLRAVIGHVDPSSYALFGSSFGAKVAFHAAARAGRTSETVEPTAIVARAPVTYNRAFDAYRETVDSEGVLRYDGDHAIDRRFFDDFDAYSFDEGAAVLDVPIAIFHGSDDESVPIDDTFEAAAALDTDVLVGKYAGEGHRFSATAEDRLRTQAFDWLGTVWPPAGSR
ncbi:MAG: alpha/beta hydrolase family protein [Halobacteriota archaeon]|uniref:alpha/beta hydrolase family protein n=1 Tax=Natronomonas sp. TaxID=2184060 RepID=UPI0039763F66